MQMMIFATGRGIVCQVNMHERLKSVDHIPTFRDMNEEYISLLKPLFERYSCRSGNTVFQQGAEADYLYLIIQGRVQVSYKPYDGTPITVAHVEQDGLFGWSAVVGSRTYTSSVTAIEDLDTFRIHGNELRKLCVDHPDAGREILERLAGVVSSRWKNSHEQVKAILVNAMTN